MMAEIESGGLRTYDMCVYVYRYAHDADDSIRFDSVPRLTCHAQLRAHSLFFGARNTEHSQGT